MPKIRAKDFNIQTGNVSSVNVVMPTHQSGDLLLVFAGKDDATGTDPTTATSGWTRGGSGVSGGATTAAVRAAWFYKVAASAAEADLVITSSDADTWSIIAMSIAGAHGTPIDASSGNGNTDSTGAPFNVTGVTTNYDHSLVVYACLSGGIGAPVPYPGIQIVDAVDSGAEGCGVGYTVKRTAGATGGHDFYTDSLNTNCIGFCVAVRDDGTSDQRAPYWDRDWATLVHPFRGSSTIITSDVWGTALTNYPALGKDAVDYAVQVDQSGGPSYVDQTTAANNATDADVTPYPATEAAGGDGTGDWFAIGYEKPFNSLLFDRAGCTQGVAGVVVWEYWNGSAWVALSGVTDGTTSFTAALGDNQEVRWTMPARFNWTKSSINSSASLYFVRARCSTLWTTNPTISQVYVGGRAIIYDAIGAATDAGVVQFENAASFTPGTSTVQTGGTYIDLGATVSLTNKIVCGTFKFTLPRDYVDAARFKEGGGVHVFFADTSFNRKAWCVGNFRDAESNDAQRNRFAIDWEQTVDTTVARTTTDPSDTIADVFFGGLGPRGALTFAVSHMAAVEPANAVINGGSSANPVTLDEFIALGDASPLQLFRDGRLMIPVTIGGSDVVHFAIDGFTLTFPGVATPWTTGIYETSPRCQAHYDEDKLGFVIAAAAGDTVKMTSGKISSPSRWRFELTAGASASATYDFDDLLLINALVTLRAVHTFAGMTFESCDVTQNGAALDGCFFVGSTISSDDPADIDNCDFTEGGLGGHAVEVTATGTYAFVGNTFSGYGPTKRTFHSTNDVNATTDVVTTDAAHGYTTGDPIIYQKMGGSAAIGLTDGATYYVRAVSTTTLAFYTSSANAVADTSRIALTAAGTETHHLYSPTAAVYNTTSGAVTLNVSGGGDVPSIRNANNSTVSTTVNNTVTVRITVRDAEDSSVIQNARVYMVADSGGPLTAGTVILSALSNASGIVEDAAFNYSSGQPVTGRVRKGSAAPLYKTSPISGTITAAGLDATVFLIADE